MARNEEKMDPKHPISRDMRRLTVVVLLLMSLAVGGTLAYMSYSTRTVQNVFAAGVTSPIPVITEDTGTGAGDQDVTSGTNTLHFTEEDDGTYSATKVVKVKNNGAAGYVRARITLPERFDANTDSYVAYDMGSGSATIDGKGTAAPANNSTELSLGGGYTLVFDEDWSKNWAYSDGWFYYKHKLPAASNSGGATIGGITEPLLAKVKSASSSQRVDVSVIAETVEDDMAGANETWHLTSSTGHYVVDSTAADGVGWE